MTKDCYFASVDLKDAFYTKRIREIDRIVFDFIGKGKISYLHH